MKIRVTYGGSPRNKLDDLIIETMGGNKLFEVYGTGYNFADDEREIAFDYKGPPL